MKNEEIQELQDSIQRIKEKKLTSQESKYDEIGLPKLKIKELQDSLKLADTYTLGQVIEMLKIDYVDMISTLGNSLGDQNKYEISIASNALKRRIQEWIQVLEKNKGKDTYFDSITGEIKATKKK